MAKVLRLDTEQKTLTIAKDIPNIFTINYADTTSERYAAALDSELEPEIIPESDSWVIAADDSELFSNDDQLMEFADA